MKEIEIKYRIDEETFTRFRNTVADAYPIDTQVDTYFSVPNGTLRVREDGLAYVTYKGVKTINEDGTTSREEIQPEINPDDAYNWMLIFNKLGFPTSLVVTKNRVTYPYSREVTLCLDYIVELDEYFAELEVVTDNQEFAAKHIKTVEAVLGLDKFQVETRGYADLVKEKVNQ